MKDPEPNELESLAESLRRAVRPGTSGETAVPGFSLLERLGEGGQGTVHQAVQLSTGRRVALKLLRKGRMATALERKRFLREIRLAASLEHAGLVTVYEAGETEEGTPYLAMELVRGEAWDVWSDRIRAREEEASELRVLRTFAELCDAVAHAHERGVLHRDLKPSNVLVEEGDRPRVLDLGLATSLEVDDTSDLESRTSDFLGSLPWMPPERIHGAGDPAPAGDVHALGLLLHRALTGRHAYKYGSSITSIVSGVESLPDVLEGPFSADRRLDRGCLAILSKALDENPEQRHADAAALAAEVRELLSGAALELRRRPRLRAGPVGAGLGVVLLAAVVLTAWRGLPVSRAERATFEAIELARDDGLAGWKALFATPCEVGQGDWQVPGPESTTLNAWRLAATHVYCSFPAERIDQLDPQHTWDSLRASGDGALYLVGDDAHRFTLMVRDDDGLHTVSVPDTSYLVIHLPRVGRWCLSGTDNDEVEVFRVNSHNELEHTRTLSDLRILAVSNIRPLLVARHTMSSSIRVIDIESGAVLDEVASDDTPTTAAFGPADRQLWLRHVSGRWSSVELGGEAHALVDVPEVKGASQFTPLANGQLYLRDGVDHVALDLASGDRRLLAAEGASSTTVSAIGSEIIWPSTKGVRRFRPARYSNALVDWIQPEGWPASDLADVQVLSTTGEVALLRHGGEIVVLDASARDVPLVLSAGIRDDTFHDVAGTDRGWMASRGGSLYVFDGAVERSFDVSGDDTIYGFDYDGSGTVYVTTAAGRVGVVDLDAPGSVEWLHQHPSFGSVVELSPDGRWLAAGDSLGELVFLALDGSGEKVLRSEPTRSADDRIPELAWDAPSHWTLSGRRRNGAIFWCGPETEGFYSENNGLGAARAVLYDETRREWITGHESGVAAQWSAGADAPHLQVDLSGGPSIWAFALSPDGRFLAVGAGRGVSVWDWGSKRRLFASSAHDGLVFSVAFHETLPQLASAAEHGELFVWDFARVDDLALQAPAR